MMKIAGDQIFKLSGIGLLILLLVALANGCGQQTTDNTTTTTTLPTSGGVTINGNLYTGVIRTAAVKSQASGVRVMANAAGPISGYQVIAVGTKDDKVYFPDAKTGASDGSFSIAVPAGESFYLEVIDDKNKFVAPVSFAAAGGEVIMAVTPETASQIGLGTIVYESGKGAAVPTAELGAALLDESSTAKPKSVDAFVPVGAGVMGRGTAEAKFTGTLQDKIDEDNDGLPDVVDIDDNGDGKVDGLDPTPRLANRVEVKIAGVNNTNAFSNLPLQYENYPTYLGGSANLSPIDIGTNTSLAIEVVMPPGTDPATFSDIRVVEGPAWLATAKVTGNGGGPAPLWQDSNYQLTQSSDRWEIHVTPYGTPEAGDVLKFKVTGAAGTAEFISTITYVFKDVPRLVKYSYLDGTNQVTKEGADLNLTIYTANGNAFSYKGSTVTFFWTAPKDDTGVYITGMRDILDGINYYSGGTPRSTPSLTISPTEISDATFGTVKTYTFTPTAEAFDYFKVDIKAESPTSGGGNASQMVNFKKVL